MEIITTIFLDAISLAATILASFVGYLIIKELLKDI